MTKVKKIKELIENAKSRFNILQKDIFYCIKISLEMAIIEIVNQWTMKNK